MVLDFSDLILTAPAVHVAFSLFVSVSLTFGSMVMDKDFVVYMVFS